jgi:hypothetical protein
MSVYVAEVSAQAEPPPASDAPDGTSATASAALATSLSISAVLGTVHRQFAALQSRVPAMICSANMVIARRAGSVGMPGGWK